MSNPETGVGQGRQQAITETQGKQSKAKNTTRQCKKTRQTGQGKQENEILGYNT